MDTDFTGGLIVNPCDVKAEPKSPEPSPSPTPAPAPPPLITKYDPDVVIKQESHVPHVTKPQQSVLKQPTIVITGRVSNGVKFNQTRVQISFGY